MDLWKTNQERIAINYSRTDEGMNNGGKDMRGDGDNPHSSLRSMLGCSPLTLARLLIWLKINIVSEPTVTLRRFKPMNFHACSNLNLMLHSLSTLDFSRAFDLVKHTC